MYGQGNTKITDEMKVKIKLLRKEGMPLELIAERFGVSKHYVSAITRKKKKLK